MRWFKHLSDASDDDFLQVVEAEFGLAGYARWFKILEIVSKTTDGKSVVAARALPWSQWQDKLKGKPKQLRTFLERLQNVGKISLKDTGNVLEITVCNLLKYRDEYTKNSRATHKRLTSDSVPKNTENRVQRTEETTPPVVPPPGDASNPAQIESCTAKQRQKLRRESLATRVPEPFTITDEMRQWAAEHTPRVDADAATVQFVDFWRGMPGAKGRKLDWFATWRNSMRNCEQRGLLLKKQAASFPKNFIPFRFEAK